MTSERIRVLHLVETLGVGGMENGLVNLANHFDYERFDFGIVCFTTVGPMAGRIVAPSARVMALGFSPGWHLGAVVVLAHLLRRNHIDILHCHGWGDRSFLGLVAARLAWSPYCLNGEHGGLHNLRTRRQALLQRLVAARFDRTVTVSEALKQKLLERVGLGGERVTVIPNGVDVRKFNGHYPRPATRSALGLDPDSWVVAVVGTLKFEKNQAVVLEALARLVASGGRMHLLLVGDGPDRAALEERARSLGIRPAVSMAGRSEHVEKILAAVDTLVLPSVPAHEGMSNVILEAMASGVPVITSESVGARELVEPERTGLLFDHADAAGLATQLLRIQQDAALRLRLVQDAGELVRSSFSLETMTRRYQDLYEGLMNRVRRASERPRLPEAP